jgi:predicted ATPase
VEKYPDAMQGALVRHDQISRGAIEGHGGVVLSEMGDGMAAAFASPADAVAAALEAQFALRDEPWREVGALRARMGLHAGDGVLRADGHYANAPLNRCARLMAAAHGGQVIISDSVEVLVRDGLAPEITVADLGEHRLRDLVQPVRVFQLCAAGLVTDFPPLRSVDAVPGNLPRQVTTFVGREAETTSLSELVGRSSLVTLTGVGGVGKSRLALQIAADVIGEFPDGAWLCELAPVTNPAALWATLGACLRVQLLPGRTLEESALDYLAAKRLLLVLDNCEHVVDAAAQLVDAIERRCPRVSVLATSREGLGLAGEQVVAVPSLGVPASDAPIDELAQAEAVRLFSDRATAAKHDFALTDRNLGAVGVLCRRLDGIPLAIELAAARVRSLSPEDLVSRLDQRFKLLTQGSRAALERHQTLRNTIDWSYDLLTPTERLGLQRLSVFAGGCDLSAAEAVLPDDALGASDVVDVLGQLVDKSLVVADDVEGRMRYRLLETIRQYAREQLDASGGSATLRRRHADHYVAVAEAAGPHLRARDHLEWTRVIERDIDNLRAALDWTVETPSPEHALRLVAPLALQGRTGELAMDWAAIAITIPGGDSHPLFPVVAAWAAWSATMGREFERADELVAVAERAQAVLGLRLPSVARARTTAAFFVNDFEGARRHAAEWVDLARDSGNDEELSNALLMLGSALRFTEPTRDAAIATVEDSVRIARAAGVDTLLGLGLSTIAFWLPAEESQRARALLDEAIEVSTRIGDRLGAANALGNVAGLASRSGDWRTALRAAVVSAEEKLELGAQLIMSGSLFWAGVSLSALGSYEPAAILIGNANAMTEPWVPEWILEIKATTDAALLDALGEQRLVTLTQQGAALEITDVVSYLRTETNRILGTQ